MPTTTIITIFIVSLLIGLSKGGLGPIVIALVTPVLSLVMGVPQAVATALPLLLIGDVFALWSYWGKWDTRQIWLLLPAAVVGIVLGTYLLTTLPDVALRRVLGAFSLAFVGYKLLEMRFDTLTYHPKKWHGVLAGGIAGIGSALANIGSPPFTAYMLMLNVSPLSFVGTATLFFTAINVLKLPGYISAGLIDMAIIVRVIWWAVPVLIAGVLLGRWFIKVVKPIIFNWIMLGLLTLAGFYYLFG